MSYIYKQYHRRNLPHFHSPGATLFVTFRLAGSVPQNILRDWKAERVLLEREIQRTKRESLNNSQLETVNQKERLLKFRRQWFKRFEDILHKSATGPTWLKDDRVAELVANSIRYRDGQIYKLDAYCIMSNHVHVVFMPFLDERSLNEKRGVRLFYESDKPPLDAIMHSLKSFTAQEANKLLNRTGPFWEAESYDHEVRNETEYNRIIRYVLNNPVKAGFVKDWHDWPWNWCRGTIGQPVEQGN